MSRHSIAWLAVGGALLVGFTAWKLANIQRTPFTPAKADSPRTKEQKSGLLIPATAIAIEGTPVSKEHEKSLDGDTQGGLPVRQEYSEPRMGLFSVRQLLGDGDFLLALVNPETFDREQLNSMIKKATLAMDTAVQEEVAARVDAGLATKLQGYTQGQEFKPPPRDKSLFGNYVFTAEGEALEVQLPREEYPEIYSIYNYKCELEAAVARMPASKASAGTSPK